jgi:hypothetical protein
MEFTIPDSGHEKSPRIRADILDIAITFAYGNPETYRSISAAAPRHTPPHRRDIRSIKGDGSDYSEGR